MKTKLMAFLCFVCMMISCLAPLSVQAAAKTNWNGWSGSSYQIKDGVLCLGANASFKKSINLPDNYTVKMTARILKKDGSMGFQIMNGKIRSGIYMNTTGFDSFGGQYCKTDVGNAWHDYRVEVKGNYHEFYMDGKKYLAGEAKEWAVTANVQFFVTGDGLLEVENFEVIVPASDEYDGSLLTAPTETEYAPEFTVDWADPESYKDWTITPAPEQIKINPETGILTFDIKAKAGYYQVERAAKLPDNFDFEFKLKIEKYGDKSFHFKATHPGYNNYQYLRPDRITMTTEPHRLSGGMGLFADIGFDWHDWKMEVRGKWVTLYLDGGELYRFEQALAPNQGNLLRFLMQATPNDEYLIHLGKVHYKPYFPEVNLTAPANGSEFVEGSEILFQANTTENVDYVDYYVNGLKVGKGYAPGYEFALKDAKVGTYRVNVGVGDKMGVESVVTVKKGFDAQIKAEKESVKYGENAVVFLECKQLDQTASVMPTEVEYFVDGHFAGKSMAAPFRYELSNLEVGTTSVFAKVKNANGAHYLTDEFLIETVSDCTIPVKFDREYELDYDYNSENAEIEIQDGYFELKARYEGDKLIYESAEGTKEVVLGKGKYKIVTTSGLVDLYYNGHFAVSWWMNRNEAVNMAKQTGLSGFEMGGTGVKTEYFVDGWKGDANYSAKLNYVPRNYSIEFDKKDISNETIAFYDGEYEIKIEFKDGVMSTKNHNIQSDTPFDYTLIEKARPGYYRFTVAKGLVQVWIDNVYVDSYAAVASARSPELVRTMTNPDSSTFVAVKGTNDRYYHSDDFSGNQEMDALDYWIPDVDTVTATNVKTATESYMKLEGTGDWYLNSQSDDFKMKWSAKVSGTKAFYVTPRVFRGPYYHMNVGYDYDKNVWYMKQWSKDTRYRVDKRDEFAGPKLTTDEWHDFEMELKENTLVLKMDGETVIETGAVDMPFWGYTGFGIDGGSVCIDNFEYEGRCKTTAGLNSAIIGDDVGIAEFYQLSDGSVVYENSWTKKRITKDGGYTWSEAVKSGGVDVGSVEKLPDGRLFRIAHENTSNMVAYTSEDDGKTWIRMGDINSCRPAGRRVVLNSSTLLSTTGRIHVACDETWTEAKSITGLYYSDDWGVTWYEAETVMGLPTSEGINTDTTGYNFQEGTFYELPDGTIRYTARTGQGFIYYMESHDGGKTFGEFRPSQFINPLCSYAFERDNKDPNTYYAVIEYDATTYCYRYEHSPRNRFALMVSYDGAKSWEFAMTLNEWGEFPLFDACNHAIRVFDDTIYVNWNNLDSPRRSFVYAIDKSKLRTSKRFEEIHERDFRGAMGNYSFGDQVVLPKTSGEAMLFGNVIDVTVSGGMYEPKTVAEAFGAAYEASGNTVTFRMGDGKLVFTEGASSYEVNGETKAFAESCMSGGYLNIKACAEAFGKEITDSENSYVIWYNTPLTKQFLDGITDCV